MDKLLFVVNNLSFFVSHRLPIAIAAKEQGYQVAIACPENTEMDDVKSMGINVLSIPVSQQDHGPLAQLRFCYQVHKICRQYQPDICHMITLKTFLVAGTAARIAGVKKRLGSVSGLGYFFMTQNLNAKLLRLFFRPFFRFSMAGSKVKVIFQNEDDRRVLIDYADIDKANTEMIGGSGVDLTQFQYMPEPVDDIQVVLVSRMLRDKGVIEFVEAAHRIKNQGVRAKFVLAGLPDETNPASLKFEELDHWKSQGTVDWIGFCDRVSDLFSRSHIVVLPSYREGFPKVLIEAAACGRPVVTTNVPGCRDAVTLDTGLLVPVKDSESLEAAILELIDNREKRQLMGQKARERAVRIFSIDSVVAKHMDIYSEIGGLHK